MSPRECAVAAGCGAALSVLALAALVYVLLAAPSVDAVTIAAGCLLGCLSATGIAWRARAEARREREVDELLERILRD